MFYLAKLGTLAGISGGRRRFALGRSWDAEVHRYLGARSYEFRFASTWSEYEPAESSTMKLPVEVSAGEGSEDDGDAEQIAA